MQRVVYCGAQVTTDEPRSTPSDGQRRMQVSVNDFPRAAEPYKMPLLDIVRGGWHLWRSQVKHTRKHLALERERGYRLRNLNDGHFMGFRPWCDTQLYPCPDSRRACCMCQHGETPDQAMEAQE